MTGNLPKNITAFLLVILDAVGKPANVSHGGEDQYLHVKVIIRKFLITEYLI